MDQSPQSHDLLADFQGSGRFLLTALPQNEKEIQDALDRGDAQVIVRVLPGFGRDILLGRPTSAQILVDGTNSNTASLASAYTSQLVAALFGERGHAADAVPHDGPRRHGNHEPESAAHHRQRAGLVQSRPEEPQLLRARRDLQPDHGGDRDAHRHGHRARKRDRHHGTVDGDAHPPHGADDRQDDAGRHWWA